MITSNKNSNSKKQPQPQPVNDSKHNKPMNKKLFITGFTGSIGSHLVKAFRNRKWRVVPWDPRVNSAKAMVARKEKADALIIAHGGDGANQYEVFAKNTFSVSNILRQIDGLLKPGGCVIVLTSRRALRPTEEEWEYAAAKAAAHAYALALYRSRPHLRITAIAPGWVQSRLARRLGATKVIPVGQLCDLIAACVAADKVRIPQLFLEPLGSSEF
jgi:NAD(P)-dependent dehydrogenase (short-subunit alcohol dehydrogenase family)